MKSLHRRLLLLVLAACAPLLAQTPVASRLRMPTPAEYAAVLAKEPETPRLATVTATRLREQTQALKARAEKDRQGLATLVKGFRGEIAPAFAWVRDAVAFEAYPGVLRGAQGTLHARRGNAADRALLLAKLLEESGFETRFALGELDDGVARKLLARTLEPRTGENPIEAIAGWVSQELVDELATRARRDHAAVATALGGDGIKGPAFVADELLAQVKQHVWVQARTEKGWIDLDPAFPDAREGSTSCTASSVVPAVPADRFQSVTVRVLTEYLDQDKLVRATALEVTRTVPELADHDVFVMHVAGQVGSGAGGLFVTSKKGAWTPTFFLDGVMLHGTPVDFDPPATVADFGSLGGALGGADPASARTFVGEWLEIAVTIPGRGTTTTTRTLVDRAPPALRRSAAITKAALAALDRDKAGQPTTPQELHDLVVSSGGHDLAAWTRGIAEFATEFEDGKKEGEPDSQPSTQPAPDGTPEGILARFALGNRAWALLSDGLVVSALGDRPGLRFYVDSPRIWILTQGSTGGDDGRFLRSDVVRQDLGVHAATPEDAAGIALRRIWLGVLEGALEHAIVARRTTELAGEGVLPDSASASYAKDAMVVLRPGSEGTLADTVADRDLASRLSDALAAGSTLIVGKKVLARKGTLAALGWWELQGSGQLRAVLGADYGGAQTGFAPANRSVFHDKIRSADMMKRRPIDVNAHKIKGGREYETLLSKVRWFIAMNAEAFAIGCLTAYAVSIYAWFH